MNRRTRSQRYLRRAIILVGALMSIVALAGCGDSDSTSNLSGAAVGGTCSSVKPAPLKAKNAQPSKSASAGKTYDGQAAVTTTVKTYDGQAAVTTSSKPGC